MLIARLVLVLLSTLPHLLLSQHQQQQQQCDISDSDDQTCTPPPPSQEQQSSNNDDHTHTPLKLPSDFIDPCQDLQPDCPLWATQGECNNNPNYMLGSCARSCGTCTALKRNRVGDEGDGGERVHNKDVACTDVHEQCGQWAKEGECLINPLCKLYYLLFSVFIHTMLLSSFSLIYHSYSFDIQYLFLSNALNAVWWGMQSCNIHANTLVGNVSMFIKIENWVYQRITCE